MAPVLAVKSECAANLPLGWKWVSLRDAARVFTGSAAPQGPEYFCEDGPPFARVSDLGVVRRTTNLVTFRDRLSPRALEGAQLTLAKKGTIIFPKSGAAIAGNNRAILGADAYIVSHLMAVEAKAGVMASWLYWWLCQIDMMMYGANDTYPSLKQSVVEKIEVPLPPLAEQERIVHILDERMAAVDSARAAATAQLASARLLGRALTREIFSPTATSRWASKRLAEISTVSGGIQKSPDRAPQKFHRPFLTVRNVQRGYLDLSDIERFEVTPEELARCRLVRGDILIVEGNGSRGHIGRNAIYQGEPEDCIHQNHIIRVRVNHRVALAEFVSLFLNSGRGAAQMLEKAKTSTGLYTLSVSKIEQLQISLPPLDEQIRIVKRTRGIEAAVGKVEQAVREQLAAIEALPARLLAEAYLGHC